MAYPIEKIVKVNTFVEAGGLGNVNFGIATIMGLSDELKGGQTWDVKTFKSFSALSDVTNYFDTNSETYRIASRWFAAGGGEVFIYLRDENNDSALESANDARKKMWFYHTFFTKEVMTDESAVVGLADWADSSTAYLWLCTSDANVADPNVSSDIASTLMSKGNRHVSIGYRDANTVAKDPSQIYCMVGLAALFSRVNYQGLATTITGDFKTVNGVVGEDLTTTAYTALTKKRVTFFTKVTAGNQVDASVSRNTWSMSASKEFADDIINIDAMVSAVQVALYNSFRRNKKIQLTPTGEAVQIGEAANALKGYYDNGTLGAGLIPHPLTNELEFAQFGYVIYTKPEDILNISSADKRDRKMSPINARVNLARAGHSIVVDLTVQ